MLVVFIVIILITALLIVIGYTLNTTVFAQLQNNPLFSHLPSGAVSAFGSAVQYTLGTYGFIVVLVIVLAVAGTIAAIFGLQSGPEETETYGIED